MAATGNLDRFLDDQEPAPQKRGPGRPKGSLNTPKEAIETKRKVKATYSRIKPHLTKAQKDYLDGALDGSCDVEPIHEMAILVRYASLYASDLLTDALDFEDGQETTSRTNPMNLAKALDLYRQAAVDLYKMQKEEREEANKREDEEGLVNVTTALQPEDRLAARLA